MVTMQGISGEQIAMRQRTVRPYREEEHQKRRIWEIKQ